MWVGGHGQVGWFLARFAGLEKRDRRAVAIASMLPDLDGLSVLFGYGWYYRAHHVWLHNVFAALLLSLACAALGRRRLSVFALSMLGIALHVLSDGFGLLALTPLWPWRSDVFWPNDARYWVAAVSEIAVPVLLVLAQVAWLRRDGTSALEVLPERWERWLARWWRSRRDRAAASRA